MKSSEFSFAHGQPNILHLSGISKEDYIAPEDIADKKFLKEENITISKYIYPNYDKIPYIFNSIDDWPCGTNLHCWSCGFTFDGKPIFVPTYIRENSHTGIEFGVKGNMCTFNCAARWIISNGNVEDIWKHQDNLNILYFLFTGKHIQIKPAPEKTCLKKYGGDLSDEEFWEELKKLDTISGLKNHTPGSIIPERDRNIQILSIIKNDIGVDYPIKRVISNELIDDSKLHVLIPGKQLFTPLGSVWNLCNLGNLDNLPDENNDEYDILDDILNLI